jgi:hypothetical protein
MEGPMAFPLEQIRYRAAWMELVAYLDEHTVEMHILTDAGESVAIVCDKDSIFAVQRHIEQIGRACPEIATWKSARTGESARDSDRSACEAAV